MKTPLKLTLMFVIASIGLASCRSYRQYSDVVKETYIHKYGTPMTLNDWVTQGQDGQIVALKKDGVTVATSFVKGVVHGPTTYSFPNSSTIQFVETFTNGELVSKKENYSSGIPMKEEIFQQGILSACMRWYEDGTPHIKEQYQDGLLVSGEYRSPLNVLESRVTDGTGVRILRTSDGDLTTKDTIQNGQMVERITYFSNGEPSTTVSFKNGQVHGTKLTFLPGGLPHTVEEWKNGMQDGTTVVFQNGERFAEIPYVCGQKHGVESRYRDGHELVEEINWKNDREHGQRKLHIDGTVSSEWYFEGEIVSRATFERMNMPRR